ncbi:MAG: hypothetical protein EHM16_12610, partial [Betaproteobacteria bacterium]
MRDTQAVPLPLDGGTAADVGKKLFKNNLLLHVFAAETILSKLICHDTLRIVSGSFGHTSIARLPMNCAERLVDLFGSQAEVARRFRLDRAVVNHWVKSGYVPARWAMEV